MRTSRCRSKRRLLIGWIRVTSTRAPQVRSTRLFASGDKFLGYNTDGVGLVRDLTTNLGCELRDKRVLILGAGGAVRGIIGPVLGASPNCVVVANRTGSKAQALVDRFEDPRLSAADPDALDRAFDIVINGTSAGLIGSTAEAASARHRRQPRLRHGLRRQRGSVLRVGCASKARRVAVDGLGMLVEQAAEAFALFHGSRPDSAAVLRALRAS